MKASLLARLDHLTERYDEVGHLLSDADVIAEQSNFRKLSQEYAELEPIAKTYQRFVRASNDVAAARLMLQDSDAEMREMAREEVKQGEVKLVDLEEALQKLLLPRDPNDNCNVFLEIRAGTGGDEAAIFSGDLFRMYSRYAESRRFTPSLSLNPVHTECSGCRRRSPRGAFTHPPVQ